MDQLQMVSVKTRLCASLRYLYYKMPASDFAKLDAIAYIKTVVKWNSYNTVLEWETEYNSWCCLHGFEHLSFLEENGQSWILLPPQWSNLSVLLKQYDQFQGEQIFLVPLLEQLR